MMPNIEGNYKVISNLTHYQAQDLINYLQVNIEEIISHYLYSDGDYLEVPNVSFYNIGLDKDS